VRRPPRGRQASAKAQGNDTLSRVAHHGDDQQLVPRGNRRGAASNERVPVRRGALIVGMAVQGDLEPGDAVVLRRSAAVMVIGHVEGHCPASRRRRGEHEQGRDGQGSPDRTRHGREYPRCVLTRQNDRAEAQRPAAERHPGHRQSHSWRSATTPEPKVKGSSPIGRTTPATTYRHAPSHTRFGLPLGYRLRNPQSVERKPDGGSVPPGGLHTPLGIGQLTN
jgi:hypothetical protein